MDDYQQFLAKVSTAEGLEEWKQEVGSHHQELLLMYLQFGYMTPNITPSEAVFPHI